MNDLQQFFNSLNSFFDKIYVITLKRATHRHEHLIKELEGLNYTIFYGQDKLEFDIKDLERKNIYNEELARKHHRYHKPMPAGMIGCSWSHKLIYEEVIRNNFQKILIMEDDIVIDKQTIKLFSHALNDLPKDWELFYLGYDKHEQIKPLDYLKIGVYHLQRFLGMLKYNHTIIGNLYPKKITKYICTAGYHDHTHAYAITTAGAEKLNQLQTPIKFFPDNLLAYAATNEIIKSYIVKPKMINQLSQNPEKRIYSFIHD